MNQCSQRITDYILNQYGVSPDFPWEKSSDAMVFRHGDTRKWFGLIMHVGMDKLRLECEEDYSIDVINLKCDPLLSGSIMATNPGVIPAYHMNHREWITVFLDGSVEDSLVEYLVDISFSLTDKKTAARRKAKAQTDPDERQSWIIPASPSVYDVDKAFRLSEDNQIIWHQNVNLRVGDYLYIYMTAPVSAIIYQCRVTASELTVGEPGDSGNRFMKIKLITKFNPDMYPVSLMRENGMGPVRGARRLTNSMKCLIEGEY